MNLDKIKKVVEKLLQHMNLQAEVSVMDDEDLKLPFLLITAEDPSILIGYKGETLMALSHILKRIADAEQDQENKLSFIVDVNGYQKKRINEIKDKARVLVERARYYKSSVEMDPMSPYERMIVHALYSQDPHIKTSSTGFGKERKITLEYID